MLQQPEDRLGDEPQETVVDGQFETRRQLGLEHVLDFGPAYRVALVSALVPAGTLRAGPVKPMM